MEKINLLTIKKIQSDFPQVTITSSKQSAEFMKQFYSDDIEIFESVFVLLLNRSNKTLHYAKISQGGVAGTVVDPKIVAKYAVDVLASGVIIAHNHPSGNLSPSDADRSLTIKIKEGLKMLDIELIDHIILTKDSYYSFADNSFV